MRLCLLRLLTGLAEYAVHVGRVDQFDGLVRCEDQTRYHTLAASTAVYLVCDQLLLLFGWSVTPTQVHFLLLFVDSQLAGGGLAEHTETFTSHLVLDLTVAWVH